MRRAPPCGRPTRRCRARCRATGPSITGSADTSYQRRPRSQAGARQHDDRDQPARLSRRRWCSRCSAASARSTRCRAAEATVRAGRETLRTTESSVLLEAVTAYMDVVRDQAIVRLRENNVTVLTRELQGDAGPLQGRRGDAHRRGAGAGAPRRRRGGARSGARQPEDQPRHLRAGGRPSAEQPGGAAGRAGWCRRRCTRASRSRRARARAWWRRSTASRRRASTST